MAIPSAALADYLEDLLPEEWSVIVGPVTSLEAPALVIRADSPWIVPSAFCHDEQRYAAVAVVSAASGADGEADLHRLIIELMDNLPEGWKFESAQAPVLDQSTGSALLAAIIRLTYANSEQEAS